MGQINPQNEVDDREKERQLSKGALHPIIKAHVVKVRVARLPIA